jgi:hypothetical protein
MRVATKRTRAPQIELAFSARNNAQRPALLRTNMPVAPVAGSDEQRAE